MPNATQTPAPEADEPGRVVLIDFAAEKGGIQIR